MATDWDDYEDIEDQDLEDQLDELYDRAYRDEVNGKDDWEDEEE